MSEAAGQKSADNTWVVPSASGAELPADIGTLQSDETYVGYEKAEGFASPERVSPDQAGTYAAGAPALNRWSLKGNWTIGGEAATVNQPGE